MKTRQIACAVFALALIFTTQSLANDAIDDAINAVLTVEKSGKGHAEAAKAMQTLRSATKADIPRLLNAMDRTNKISANWIRGVIVAASQRDGKFPLDEVNTYFNDTSHSHYGRLMAFELLSDQNSDFAKSTIPKLMDDPSLPLKQMGIKWCIEQAANAGDGRESIGFLGSALDSARDLGQVTEIAGLLSEKGIEVDLQSQLGFINSWHLVGTFDNKNEEGFDVAYGPEKDPTNINLEEDSYQDSEGNEVKWFAHSTVDPTGVVDLVKAIGPIKGATTYAYTVFNAEEAGPVDLRIGCINAHKIWVNGKLVMSNEIYHNGMSPDKFIEQAEFNEGPNTIMVKVCQNEQTQPWAQKWEFQLRVCDDTGKAIKPAEVGPPQR